MLTEVFSRYKFDRVGNIQINLAKVELNMEKTPLFLNTFKIKECTSKNNRPDKQFCSNGQEDALKAKLDPLSVGEQLMDRMKGEDFRDVCFAPGFTFLDLSGKLGTATLGGNANKYRQINRKDNLRHLRWS